MKKIVLLGCGGHAKSVIDTIECNGEHEIVGLLGTGLDLSFSYRGYICIGNDDKLLELFSSGVNYAFVTIGMMGDPTIRELLYKKLRAIGFSIPTIVDGTASIASDAIIGEGTYIGKKAIVNSDSKINEMCIINSGAIVEHDCNIGSNSHISVGTVLCGNVSVSECTFIGANSTVIQGREIGKNVIIGANSLVLRNVRSNEKVYGIVK